MKKHRAVQYWVILLLIVGFIVNCAKRVPEADSTAGEETMDKAEFMKVAGVDEKLIGMGVSSRMFRGEILLPGDQLDIVIFEKLPISPEKRIDKKRVGEDGRVFILPIGEVTVAGLALSRAEQVIEEKLSEYVISPHCEISIEKRAFEPHVFIFGEANETGTIPLKQGDHLLDVIAAAGGCKSDAYRRSIKIIRTRGDKVTMLSIDLYDAIARGKKSENPLLYDQDIVYVPRRFITNLKEVAAVIGILLPWYFFLQNLFPDQLTPQ